MIVKMCIICAKRITNTDISEGRAYRSGELFCCSDCLRLIARQREKPTPSVYNAKLTVFYCIQCGGKLKEEDIEDGRAVIVTDIADRVGKTAVCGECSKSLLSMVKSWSEDEKKKAAVLKDQNVTALDIPLPPQPAQKQTTPSGRRRSGRLAEAEAAMIRRSRMLPPEVAVKPAERRRASKFWLFAVTVVIIIAVAFFFLRWRAERERQKKFFAELQQSIDNALGDEDFETALNHIDEFAELHPDLTELKEFKSIRTSAHNRIHRLLKNKCHTITEIPVEIERLLKLISLKEEVGRIAPLSDKETFAQLVRRIETYIGELRRKLIERLGEFQVEFDRSFAEKDLDRAEDVIKRWEKELDSAKAGFNEEERKSEEVALADAKQKLLSTETALENEWHYIEKQASVKEFEGDYATAAEFYKRYSNIKYRPVSEAATERWKSAVKKANERLMQYENDEKIAQAAYEGGDFEDARSIYLRYVDDGMEEIRKRARAALKVVEEAINKQQERKRIRKAKVDMFNKSLSSIEKMLDSEPERVIEWCRTRLKTINEVPLPDAKKMVLKLRDRAYRRLAFVRLPDGNFIVGSHDPFDENPHRKVTLGTGVYLSLYEVSNAEYKKFIDAGGYRNKKYWTEDGWRKISQFVDSTGKPGPSFWWNGTYPIGAGSEPVRGISWYEANAYAKWARSRLPTAEEWEIAAGWDEREQKILEYPWGDTDKASIGNIGRKKVSSVKESYNDVSPSGVINSGGNVSEWTATVENGKAVVKGGNFLDIDHTAARVRFSQKLPLDARLLYVGFRCVREEK